MSFRKLTNSKLFQKPFISNGFEKNKFFATYKAYKDKIKDYNDPSKYDHIKTDKFIPFFGWIETYEYRKKD